MVTLQLLGELICRANMNRPPSTKEGSIIRLSPVCLQRNLQLLRFSQSFSCGGFRIILILSSLSKIPESMTSITKQLFAGPSSSFTMSEKHPFPKLSLQKFEEYEAYELRTELLSCRQSSPKLLLDSCTFILTDGVSQLRVLRLMAVFRRR